MFHALSSVPAQGMGLAAPPVAAQKTASGTRPAAGAAEPARAAPSTFGPAARVQVSAAAKTAPAQGKPANPEALSEDEERQVQKLRQRDAQVRAHEQAHSAAGGGLAGGASYSFVTGPDGKRYAVGGEVQIDASPVRDNPAATVAKMDIVIRAALAPADPSAQDQAVARDAAKARAAAQNELQKQKETESRPGAPPAGAMAAQEIRSGDSAQTPSEPSASQRLEAMRAYSGQPANMDDIAAEIFSAAAQLP